MNAHTLHPRYPATAPSVASRQPFDPHFHAHWTAPPPFSGVSIQEVAAKLLIKPSQCFSLTALKRYLISKAVHTSRIVRTSGTGKRPAESFAAKSRQACSCGAAALLSSLWLLSHTKMCEPWSRTALTPAMPAREIQGLTIQQGCTSRKNSVENTNLHEQDVLQHPGSPRHRLRRSHYHMTTRSESFFPSSGRHVDEDTQRKCLQQQNSSRAAHIKSSRAIALHHSFDWWHDFPE